MGRRDSSRVAGPPRGEASGGALARWYECPMRAVVIQHEESEGLGLLGPALKAAGFELTHRFRGAHHDDVSVDLVVVLGGRMGVYEAAQHPFLLDERAVLAERLALDRPCLGVCLGAQLLASAAGAEVSPGKNGLEVGVAAVRMTRDAGLDPAFAGAGPKLTVAHWHADTFGPVPGAALLASSDRYTQQAFRVGRSYGLQFHAELTADAFGSWLQAGQDELRGAGKDPSQLQAQLGKLRGAEASLEALLTRLARALAGR
jgi:GMP synthase (glutamine-hydrolysing)